MEKHIIGILIIINFTLTGKVSAQEQSKVDSIKQVIAIAKHDTTYAKGYLDLGYLYEHISPDTAMHFYLKVIEIANKTIHSLPKETKSRQDTMPYELLSLKAKAIQNMGWIYKNQGYDDKALEHFQNALKINEKIGNKAGIATNLGNIGIVYMGQSIYDKALQYHQKALKYFEDIEDENGIATNLAYIAGFYSIQGDSEKALEYYNKALRIFKAIGDNYAFATFSLNMGDIYYDQGNFSLALEYFQKSLKVYEAIGNKYGIAYCYLNMGRLLIDLKQYKDAMNYEWKALIIAKEIGALSLQSVIYSYISNSYKGLKQYENALAYQDSFIVLNDSVYNTEKSKAIAEMNTRYETEKKEKQIIQQQAELETSKLKAEKEKAEKEHQRTQRNIFIVAFCITIVLVVFIFRSYNQKKKANQLLTLQKQLITEANEELNRQNEEITAQRDEIESQRDIVIQQKKLMEEIHHEISQSIDYATRLQSAILPEGEILDKYLSGHFVLFKPKDKVSGDFYWWSHVENHTVITAADSTGHGVPGAFMSMLGSSFLREIVQKEYITHTGVILRKLRKEIIKALNQKGEIGEQKDGMDMAIISINHETNVVQFSGANNPLYILTNRKLAGLKPLDDFKNFYEIKPDNMPIAIYEKMDNFTTHEIQLEKGDILYMFSDGFADQFGGSEGKKFKYKPFKLLLSENRNKPMIEQKELLNKAFETWKGNLEQIDDIVVVGIKI